MARAAYWKGHLKLSLVTAKVSLMPAITASNAVRFHILNRLTGNRVESRYVDRETHRPVSKRNQVKGYPKDGEEDAFVLLEADELDAVALESTRTIAIDSFVPASSISWIWYDRPHFLKPDDKLSTEAYGVILTAMVQRKVVGIARLVLYGREHAVLLEPAGKGMILWTVRYGETVREPVVEFASASKSERKAVDSLGEKMSGAVKPWKPALVKDPLQPKLQRLLKEGEKKTTRKTSNKETPKPRQGKVIDITEALRKSIAADKRKRA